MKSEEETPAGSRRENRDCSSENKKTSQVPSLVFYQDEQVERIRDVGAARLSASSEEPFVNSFLAFFHKKEGIDQPSEANTVPTITYDKDTSAPDDEKKEKVDDVVTLDDGDPLLEHIEASGLPLRLRRPTVAGKSVKKRTKFLSFNFRR